MFTATSLQTATKAKKKIFFNEHKVNSFIMTIFVQKKKQNMIQKFLLVVVLAGLASFVHAQQTMEEVVYLKNGSIVRGMIIEQVPNRTIKIQTADGNVFVFDMEDIEKLTKEPVFRGRPVARNRQQVAAPDTPERKRAGRFSGMIQGMGVGFQTLAGSTGMAYFETSFVCGYRFREFLFVGGGLGVEHMIGDFRDSYNICVPVFVTAKVNMNRKRVSPYFQFDIGTRYNGNVYFQDGLFIYPKVGLDFNLGARKQRALFLSLSLFEYGNQPSYYPYHSSEYDSYPDYYEHEFYSKVGIQFGFRF
jgi:hypothetical protein